MAEERFPFSGDVFRVFSCFRFRKLFPEGARRVKWWEAPLFFLLTQI